MIKNKLTQFWMETLLGVFVLSIYFLVPMFFPLSPSIDIKNTKAIFPNYDQKANKEQIIKHNESLKELLYQRINIENANNSSHLSSHQQMRGFYVLLIIAGLLSITITARGSTSKNIKRFLLIFIPVMYILEVHNLDLNDRYKSASEIYTKEAIRLTNCISDSTTLYYFSYKDIKNQMDKASDLKWQRKGIKACSGYDAEQIVLYFLPWIIIFGWNRTGKIYNKLSRNSYIRHLLQSKKHKEN